MLVPRTSTVITEDSNFENMPKEHFSNLHLQFLTQGEIMCSTISKFDQTIHRRLSLFIIIRSTI
jgi:hypothetical protein